MQHNDKPETDVRRCSVTDIVSRTNENSSTSKTFQYANSTFKEGFGGLAALAYAAEVHSRLLPEIKKVKKRKAVKRATETECDSPTKTAKEGFCQRKAIPWLPPSPPQSDLSSSPGSVSSEDSESLQAVPGISVSSSCKTSLDKTSTYLTLPTDIKNSSKIRSTFNSLSMAGRESEHHFLYSKHALYYPESLSFFYGFKHQEGLTKTATQNLHSAWSSIRTPVIWNHSVYPAHFSAAWRPKICFWERHSLLA